MWKAKLLQNNRKISSWPQGRGIFLNQDTKSINHKTRLIHRPTLQLWTFAHNLSIRRRLQAVCCIPPRLCIYNPQSDSIWRWDFWEVNGTNALRTETPEFPRGHRKRRQTATQKQPLITSHGHCPSLDLGLPASRTERSPPAVEATGLWCFCYSNPNRLRRRVKHNPQNKRDLQHV